MNPRGPQIKGELKKDRKVVRVRTGMTYAAKRKKSLVQDSLDRKFGKERVNW